jgi:hypothetical protein
MPKRRTLQDPCPKMRKNIQQVIGRFLYYSQAVDPTMLITLSSIASKQAGPTKETMIKTHSFLD